MRELVLLGAVLSLCGAAFAPEEAPAWIPAAAEAAAEAPPPAPPARADRFDGLILLHARRNALDPVLVKAIIAVESDFTPRCASSAGALGLMQVMPATGEEMGVPPARLQEPDANIRAGTDYLNWLFRAAWRLYGIQGRRFEESPPWLRRRVIAAYHGGPRLLAAEDWPPKTRDYVGKVAGRLEEPGPAPVVYLAANEASQ
ncbi:MAG: transglycosylase SLT domain-containing protein [Elusimicrobia bacterium]|nr:transglycosylase SLT domain-containing protein [Elusimicrobiota bacterium]